MKFFGSILAVICLLFALSGSSFASPFSGLAITKILFQDDQGKAWNGPPDLTPLLAAKPGDRYSSQAISETVQYLYLTGRFKDVRVDGFPDEGGVKLVFTLMPITVVDEVMIRGNHAMAGSRILETALREVEGRELREDRFPDYRAGIQTLYQSEGYYGTAVDFEIKQLSSVHRVGLFVYIREPRRTVIGDVNFSGLGVFTKRQLIRALKSRPGEPLRTDLLFDHDLAALLQKYADAGYPGAKTGPVNISFREDKAYIVIEGREGPKVSVAFSGNRDFSDAKLKKQILIWPERDISDAIIDSSADKIKNLYKDAGYDRIKVAVRKSEGQDRLDLVFDIQEGERFTVKKIIIQGNTYFPTKHIKGELSLQESGWLGSSPFNQELVDKGVEYLRERYADAGFLGVQIREKTEFVDGTKAVVRIDINEGPQTVAGTISFEGNHALSEAELLERLSLKPGAPYNERLVDEDRYHILSAYSDRGYLYARVETQKTPGDGVVDIKYTITEDQPVRIGRIVLRGSDRTKESVIRRELLLKPGDSYDYEKILKSQQRIYRFGYFNLARFEPLRPGEKEYVKDMLVTVEERPAGSVEFGIGYGDLDRLRAFVEVAHRNMWGLGHYAGVRYEKSDILDRATLNYQHPWFFNYDVNGKFVLSWSDLEHINSDTREVYYQTRQTSASYGLEKKIRRMKTSLTYAFENVNNYNIEPGAVLSKDDVAGHIRVSSLSPALVWDLRDDIFNPQKGAVYGIVLKEAMHQLGSQADFSKVSAQSSWYLPIRRGIVTALSARAGMAWPHYQTSEIPIHERFYLGGSTTVRGYTQDSVGPTSDGTPGGIPTGGSAMWLLNAEVRFMPTDGFGLVLFSDDGRVWIDQAESGSSQIPDPRPQERASYGAGIRYGTPVGPLRIDYGQKIHRRPGESPGELHFNIGHTF